MSPEDHDGAGFMQEEENRWEKRWVSRQGGIRSVERCSHGTRKRCRSQSRVKSTPEASGNYPFICLVVAKGLRRALYKHSTEHSIKQSSTLRSAGEITDTAQFIRGRYG